LIEFNLKAAGCDVIAAEDGAEALQRARSASPDLIVLDLMLPEVEGIEVCKLLRRDPATAKVPIIILTAKAAEVDRILGLELGADDYVTKPFSPRELVLRVKKLLQRQAENEDDQKEILTAGEVVVNLPRHTVTVKGQPAELTATEFKLLALLIQRRGRVQSRDQMLQEVWNYERMVDTRTVDTHMRRLREKLGTAARHLDTVRNVGYRFVD
jgi:DNA-binding response OmpR family regulator